MELLLPPLPAMAPRMSSASLALLLQPPPTTPPKYIAQFSSTLLPSKTDVPRFTSQAISTAGTPAVQIVGWTAPWPSSTLLWPAAITVIIHPAAGVCGRCHHPGEPVQAGGVVGRVDPTPTHQVRQGAPCNGAAAVITAVVWEGGWHPLHECQQQPHHIDARRLPGVVSLRVIGLIPPSWSHGWQRQWRQRRQQQWWCQWQRPRVGSRTWLGGSSPLPPSSNVAAMRVTGKLRLRQWREQWQRWRGWQASNDEGNGPLKNSKKFYSKLIVVITYMS